MQDMLCVHTAAAAYHVTPEYAFFKISNGFQLLFAFHSFYAVRLCIIRPALMRHPGPRLLFWWLNQWQTLGCGSLRLAKLVGITGLSTILLPLQTSAGGVFDFSQIQALMCQQNQINLCIELLIHRI